MRLLKVLALGLSLRAAAAAQPTDLDKVRDAALASRYSYDFVGRLCNEVGPRLSGSPGAAAGVELVAEEMRRLGLRVRLQPVTVPHWVRGEESGSIVAFPGQRKQIEHQLHLCALGGSSATSRLGLEAAVVVVKNLEELKALGTDRVKGRIVVFNQVFDDVLAKNGFAGHAYGQAVGVRVQGPAEASKMGARAALVRSVGGVNYRLPHTGVTSFKDARAIPAAALSAEDADHIAYLAERGAVRVRLHLDAQTLEPVSSFNVIGDLVGTQSPEQFVIVSGHLDSWDLGTGALDDASGVGMALGTAQTLLSLHLRPRRTLRVIAWMNEENGGAGGRSYDAEESEVPKTHFAAIESDLGDGHPMGIEMLAGAEWAARLEFVRKALEPLGAGWIQPYPGTGADITPLSKRGVPCFHPLVDSRRYFDYHHTAADTFDKVELATLRENTAVMAVLAYGLCGLP